MDTLLIVVKESLWHHPVAHSVMFTYQDRGSTLLLLLQQDPHLLRHCHGISCRHGIFVNASIPKSDRMNPLNYIYLLLTNPRMNQSEKNQICILAIHLLQTLARICMACDHRKIRLVAYMHIFDKFMYMFARFATCCTKVIQPYKLLYDRCNLFYI
jgi:hypothetical protein